MIFVTVGNMDPFNRLVRAVDEWASSKPYPGEILAQIGKGTYHPKHCKHVEFLTPAEYIEVFERSELVVSHAGMGTIITALEKRKTLVVMPKRATLGEQRNEHQLATVHHFQRSTQIFVAESEAELGSVLDRVLESNRRSGSNGSSVGDLMDWQPEASLISFVREFISAR